MRYQIHASVPNNDGEEIEVFTDDLTDAEILFKFLLDSGVRPLYLNDTKTNTSVKYVENGVRHSC